jgi:DNA-directed RNA polymerase specialized sigma24 family protein
MTVQALRRGRPEVLAELLDRFGRDMQAVAYLIVRDRAAAEDIVADSLLAALDHGRSLRDDDALRPWLLRIATNRALRYRRRAAQRRRARGRRGSGSATPYVVPAGTSTKVTFLFPADGGWIYVNPRPGEGGALVSAADIGIPGKILIGAEGGQGGWLSP